MYLMTNMLKIAKINTHQFHESAKTQICSEGKWVALTQVNGQSAHAWYRVRGAGSAFRITQLQRRDGSGDILTAMASEAENAEVSRKGVGWIRSLRKWCGWRIGLRILCQHNFEHNKLLDT